MIRSKKKPKPVNNNSNSSAPSVTYITEETEITANIFCKDDIRIAGFIKGNVETKQKLILNESGKIEGTIISPEIDISGKMKGDIRSSSKLTLRSTAIIDGQIFTKKIAIENGAQIKGALQVGPEINVDSKNVSAFHLKDIDIEKKKSENNISSTS